MLPGFCKEVARGISIQSHTASPAQAVCFRCGSSAAGAHGGGEEEKKIALFLSVLPGNSKETLTLILCAVNPH